MQKNIFNLKGLNCEACLKFVKRRVVTIKGVVDVVPSLDGKLEVMADKDISKEEIAAVLEGTDYSVV